jgi:hypothetical protein
MFSCGHHTAIFIMSMFMLLLLKDLLAKFIITCTLKDKLLTVNFRQPSHEFTFNVGIDLLF